MKLKLNEITIAIRRFRKDLGDINSLCDSIRSNGLLHPIVVTENYELIAGRRRLEALKQLGEQEVPVFVVDGKLKQLEDGEIDENLIRKPFTTEEITEIDEFLRPRVEAAAAQRKREGRRTQLKPRAKFAHGILNTDCGRARQIIARHIGISHTTLEKLRVVKSVALSHPELYGEIWEKLRIDKITADDAFRRYKLAEQRQRLLSELTAGRDEPDYNNSFNSSFLFSTDEAAAETKVEGLLKGKGKGKGEQQIQQKQRQQLNPPVLFLGDCVQEAKGIQDSSIDLIFTDPPYGKTTLHLYGELAKIAQQKLNPGGSLVMYVGHLAIPQIVHLLEDNSNLTWWWEVAVIHNGSRNRVHKYKVWAGWKPLLWYVKGDKTNVLTDISDTIQSAPASKLVHPWEQSTIEAEHVISGLTIEGATVFDPFMGYGTTGVATVKLQRRFIGIEKDAQYFALAKKRIESAQNQPPILHGEEGQSKTLKSRCRCVGQI